MAPVRARKGLMWGQGGVPAGATRARAADGQAGGLMPPRRPAIQTSERYGRLVVVRQEGYAPNGHGRLRLYEWTTLDRLA
jgi:hypothetical protein